MESHMSWTATRPHLVEQIDDDVDDIPDEDGDDTVDEDGGGGVDYDIVFVPP